MVLESDASRVTVASLVTVCRAKTHRDDAYYLGSILFTLFASYIPFRTKTTNQMIKASGLEKAFFDEVIVYYVKVAVKV